MCWPGSLPVNPVGLCLKHRPHGPVRALLFGRNPGGRVCWGDVRGGDGRYDARMAKNRKRTRLVLLVTGILAVVVVAAVVRYRDELVAWYALRRDFEGLGKNRSAHRGGFLPPTRKGSLGFRLAWSSP